MRSNPERSNPSSISTNWAHRSYRNPTRWWHAAIAEALSQYQAAATMTLDTRYCIQSGDVALASAAWCITGTGPAGEPVEVRGTSADLLRRQTDGRWLLVIDNPFGTTTALPYTPADAPVTIERRFRTSPQRDAYSALCSNVPSTRRRPERRSPRRSLRAVRFGPSRQGRRLIERPFGAHADLCHSA